MKRQPVTRELLPKVASAMAKHPFFVGMERDQLTGIAQLAELVHYTPNEAIASQGEAAQSFGVVLNGRVREQVNAAGLARPVEVRRSGGNTTFGLVEACSGQPMRGNITAAEQILALQFPAASFDRLLGQSAALAAQVCSVLAKQLSEQEAELPLPMYDMRKSGMPPKDTMDLLKVGFVQRHRALPLRSQGNKLLVGFVGNLTASLFKRVYDRLSAHEVQPIGLSAEDFNRAMEGRGGSLEMAAMPDSGLSAAGIPGTPAPVISAVAAVPQVGAAAPVGGSDDSLVPEGRQHGPPRENNPKLDALLKRMVAEGASDLHLSAMHKPRWRIDGEIREIAEARELGQTTVMELFEPIMSDRQLREFRGKGEGHDVDFAYALPGVARFRVNLFCDRLGIGGVLRTIPDKILTFEQLNLPKTIARLCDFPKGMVLVTGPTGSGKSTTLAAMIDYINKSRRTHIITMEDPIEFVHKSRKALINQREMHVHSEGFKRALKAALRQDPDIVLVGELRDIETVSMAVETANTGHLVFGTLHTATAVSTVERIVDLFPPEQQGAVRAGVAEALKGVIAQTLCKKKGGGRIAALEIMVGSSAISNLIREGKMHQIPNMMLTAKKQGNQLLNEELEKLVRDAKVTYEDAMSKAIDKPELAKRFGREYFEE